MDSVRRGRQGSTGEHPFRLELRDNATGAGHFTTNAETSLILHARLKYDPLVMFLTELFGVPKAVLRYD